MPIELTGNININEILKSLQNAQAKANEANLQRYEALMTHMEGLTQQIGEQGTFGKAMSLMDQVGGAARTRIAEQAQKATAAAEQDLISRGLGSTTVRQAERRGIATTAERATQEAEERTAAQKAGMLTQRAGAEMQIGALKAGAISQRQDIGPDLGMFSSLIQAAAAGEKAAAAPQRTARVMAPGWSTPLKYSGEGQALRRAAPAGGAGGVSSAAGGAAGGYTPAAATGGGVFRGFTGATGAARGGAPALAGGGTVFMGGRGQVTTTPGTPATPGTISMGPAGAEPEAEPEAEPTTQPAAAPEAAGIGALAGAQAGFAGAAEYVTDYNEYKRLAGTRAVSPTYFYQVLGGRVLRRTIQRGL